MNDSNKPQMVTGFNHNIKHKGKIYHVQTEDSGVANPHIITHLFVGGNILASKKTSYADIVQADNLHSIVKELMQEQHKAMLRNLINGVYDEVLEADAAETASPVTAPSETELPPLSPRPAPSVEVDSSQKETVLIPQAQVAPAATKFPAAAPAAPLPPLGASVESAAKELPELEPPAPRPPPAPEPPSRPKQLGGEFTEGRRPITKTRILIPEQPQIETVPLMQRATARVTVRPKPAQAPALPPEVVAAQKMSDKPTPRDTSGPTIFGENLITEKSLDEVILGYLSGDGEDGG